MPGEDVWFVRFALGFLAHLAQGGWVADRLSNRAVGNQAGRPFNFGHVRGGPLLWAPDLVASGHLFIGHGVCPGFRKIAARFPWWQSTPFCAPGYDYFHDGFNYAQVPVDLAPHAYARIPLRRLEAAAWVTPAQRAVLLYSDPLEQAASYFNYCRNHPAPAYNSLNGRRLTDWEFRDYLFAHALPSYAKTFISYQVMAGEVPGSVFLMPHKRLRERPVESLTSMLSHLAGTVQDWPQLADAVELARREHLAAVEISLGRPLDRRARAKVIPMTAAHDGHCHGELDPDTRREGLSLLASLGVDPQYFETFADAAGRLPMTSVA
jgi:hypothetical protein